MIWVAGQCEVKRYFQDMFVPAVHSRKELEKMV